MSNMSFNPIIPIWAMIIICVALLVPFRKGIFNYIRQIFIVVLIFAINLRPMLPNGEVVEVVRDYNVLFVVDNTISMFAEDYSDSEGTITRMDQARKDIEYIMDKLKGASFSVMKFDNDVRTMIPFSTDRSATMMAVNTLGGQAARYANGTTLNILCDPLYNIAKLKKDDCLIVFIISDGEITNKKDKGNLDSFESIGMFVDGGAVLGYGTEEGGNMKAYDFTLGEETEYVMDRSTGDLAVSVIDEDNLKKIASDLSVDYVHVKKSSDIDSVIKKVELVVADIQATPKTKSIGFVDEYYWLAIPLVLLLIYDFIYYKKKSGVK
ncbi:MAG: VWA domain-containing protein [Lachnospiraceae bacterium]|nr:VWA domain-containing protein [Lachnospiraceae bacterium]